MLVKLCVSQKKCVFQCVKQNKETTTRVQLMFGISNMLKHRNEYLPVHINANLCSSEHRGLRVPLSTYNMIAVHSSILYVDVTAFGTTPTSDIDVMYSRRSAFYRQLIFESLAFHSSSCYCSNQAHNR